MLATVTAFEATVRSLEGKQPVTLGGAAR